MATKVFSVGDLVTLKSGGPQMTVTSINDETGWLQAMWFRKSTESIETTSVHSEALDSVEK